MTREAILGAANNSPESLMTPQDSALTSEAERFTITARNGQSYDFVVQPGQISDESTGKYAHATLASHTHPDGSVSSFYWNEFQDRFQVASITLQPEMRNSGVGLALYERLADRAVSSGKALASDSTVSSEALKIYPKLAALGYDVRYANESDAVAIDHQPRDENDTSRPPGSQQFIGRDERPIAVLVARGAAPAGSEPDYIKRLIQKKPQPSPAADAPPPLPPLPPTAPAVIKPLEREWLVALNDEPTPQSESQIKQLIALGRLDLNSLSRPKEGPGMWAPLGMQPELLSFIQQLKTPQWHVARPDPSNPNATRSFGPYSGQDLCKYAAEGLIKDTDQAWAPGMSAWEPVGKTRAGELVRLGIENGQSFTAPVDLSEKLAQRRQAAATPAAPKPAAPAGPR
jgi:hypothetical protein